MIHPFTSFVYNSYGGSSRILFILQLSSRFLLELRSAKLYSKINMVFNTCFVLRRSSILHLAFRSSILSPLSFEVVLCHCWYFPFVFHDSQVFKSDISKSIIFSSLKTSSQPINLFIGVILGYISPKAFPKDCCYFGAYQWSKFSPTLLVKEVFHCLGSLTQINGFL